MAEDTKDPNAERDRQLAQWKDHQPVNLGSGQAKPAPHYVPFKLTGGGAR